MNAIVQHCDFLVQEHHHMVYYASTPPGQQSEYYWGDGQFVKEFTQTQIFSAFIDKFMSAATN